MKTRKIIALALALALVLASAAFASAAEKVGKASEVTLEKCTGTLKVVNASGTDVQIRDNMRLYSGYTITTGTDSNAFISLDGSSALMLASASKMTLGTSGNRIRVMLESGTVVADIGETLPSSKTVDIHTTNAVTGIRGTGVEVTYSPGNNATRVCMTDGDTENYDKTDGEIHVVSAAHGIIIGGGAAEVTPIGDSIAVSDLHPDTQRLMVIDGGISEKVLDGFYESFRLKYMSAEDRQDLETSVGEALQEQTQEQKSADAAAEEGVKAAVEETGTQGSGSAEGNIDPVFETQTGATGAGAAAPGDGQGSSSGAAESGTGDDGGDDTSSGGTTGGEELSTGPVTFSVAARDSFASAFVFINDTQNDPASSGTDPATYTATPSSVVFWLCYDEGSAANGFTAECTGAYLGDTKLDKTQPPQAYSGQQVSGMFFAKSSLPDNAALRADLQIKLEKLPEDASQSGTVMSAIDNAASSQIFTKVKILYDSRDAQALSEKMKISKLEFEPYQGGSTGAEGIAIRVPDGGFFTVTLANGNETLTGTTSGEAVIYRTTAASIRATLVPQTVNEEFYTIDDIGLNAAGASTAYVSGQTYDIENPTGDLTLTYDIGVTVKLPTNTASSQEYQRVVEPMLTSLNDAPLFGARKLRYPNSMQDPTFGGLIDTTKVVTEPFYTVIFMDTNATYSYEATDGKLQTQPPTPQDREYVTPKQVQMSLTFNDWVRANPNATDPADIYISYDPAISIDDDYVYFARYRDINSGELVIPYVEESNNP